MGRNRQPRNRTVVAALVLLAVAVCAGAAAPARAAVPVKSIWWNVLGPTTADDRWVDVARGPDGSLYAAGDFAFDPFGTTTDVMVAKFSADDAAASHLLQSDEIDVSSQNVSDLAQAMAVDGSGALIVVGTTQTATGSAWFVAKWNPDLTGRPWTKLFAASPLQQWNADAWDVACTPAGDVVVCGTTQTAESTSKGVPASLVVRKLSGATGDVIWKNGYAGPKGSYNQGTAVALDAAGNVYCTGYGTNAKGDSDILVAKFRGSDGSRRWVRRIDGPRHRADEAADIAVRGTAVYVTGGEYVNARTRDAVVARYTATGRRPWVRTWREKAGTVEYPAALTTDGRGNVVVVGEGVNVPIVTREHAFVLKYSGAGLQRWRRIAYDSVSHMAAWDDVLCDSVGDIWTGGHMVVAGSASYLMARYSPTGAKVWSSQWKGFDGLGGDCAALCFANGGVFTAGKITTTAGGGDAAAIKYER